MVIVRFVWFPVQGFKGIAMFFIASIGLPGHCCNGIREGGQYPRIDGPLFSFMAIFGDQLYFVLWIRSKNHSDINLTKLIGHR